MEIKNGMYVSATYELFVGEENELMEKATTEVPLEFVFGLGQMLEAFEAQLDGKKAGDKFDFTIPCEDAYGEFDDEHIIDLPKDMFEVDGNFDEDVIFPGNMVPMMDNMGNRMNASVVEVKEETVTMDFNHPLAGENLHFVGEVINVRLATEEELNVGTGEGCGCGCDCGDEEGSCESKGCSGCN